MNFLIEKMSKRSKSFPSQAHVTIEGGVTRHGEEFLEKLGRNDPCPCGSGIVFKNCHMKKKNSPWRVGDDYSRSILPVIK